eukprot:CAMPEP_0171809924 /NCGR_PEP_ID=MMETSP0991-20121206/77220_1 /TAXON_ID=483369 /ORGANISM="non described non described, Strain CCMP2098" /LENGTH=85 /DNA_ID=CAMNT_0012423029 /DNA_START=466 /DNA_END=723 /DNA_ORIENTATION=+
MRVCVQAGTPPPLLNAVCTARFFFEGVVIFFESRHLLRDLVEHFGQQLDATHEVDLAVAPDAADAEVFCLRSQVHEALAGQCGAL